jgi:Ala-tRNA(Pro) deacylase
LHAQSAQLVAEQKFMSLFGDCEPGAEPPIGSIFGIPTVADDTLLAQEQLTFQAGTHQDAVTISKDDYVRLAQPTIAHFSRQRA